MALAFTSWRPSRSRSQVAQPVSHRSLDSRWGDQAITAPNSGGWNQQPSPNINSATSPNNLGTWGSPTSTLVNSSPEVGSDEVHTSKKHSVDADRNAITIKIPLPWYRRSIKRTRSLPRSIHSPTEESKQPPSPLQTPPNTNVSSTSPLLNHTCGCNHVNYAGEHRETLQHETKTIPAHIAHQPVLRVLSPVKEDFGPKTPTRPTKLSPAVTPIETSPSDSIRSFANPYQSLYVSLSRPLPNTTKSSEAKRHSGRKLRTRSTSRSHTRRRQTERGLGLEHTSYMRSPSVDGLMRQYGFENAAPIKEITIDSNALHENKNNGVPLTHARPLSMDSLSSTSSTDVASDGDSEVDERSADIYQKARQASKDDVNKSSKAFYAHVVNDYKKIARDIEADTHQRMEIPHRKSYTAPTKVGLEMQPPWAMDSPANHVLVPEDEELWG